MPAHFPSNLKSAVAAPPAATFTFIVCVPYFSCHASIV